MPAPTLATVLGKYKGGPFGGHVRVTYDAAAGGVVKGEYKGKAGGKAGFEGKMVEKGKKVLGFWCVFAGAAAPAAGPRARRARAPFFAHALPSLCPQV